MSLSPCIEVKEETGATIRCFPFDQPAGPHTCLYTGIEAKARIGVEYYHHS